MFHSFFQFPCKVQLLILLFTFFQFYSVVSQHRKVYNSTSSLFLLIITRSGRLAEIKWPICISKSQISLCVSFFRRDSGFYIYHLFVWPNLNFLQNSLRITLPTRLCLVLYSFCDNLQYSLIMWLIVSSLSPDNKLLLFCCVLSICALIWLVFMSLFCAAIRRDSLSLLRFPFLAMSTFSRVRCRLLVV